LPGAKPDWEILIEIAKFLGQKWSYNSPQDILLEIAASNPFYSGLAWERLGAQGIRIQEQQGQMELNDADIAMRKGAAHA